MKATLGKSWMKKVKRKIDGYEFEVGILQDKPHYDPVYHGLFEEPSLSKYAGGPIRDKSNQLGPLTTGQILIKNMERLQRNILLEPFRKKNSDILAFTSYFLKFIFSKPGVNPNRLTNLLQAIVRNPILRKEYGNNSRATIENKGFDRHLFDTGEMFKSIKAKVIRRGGS